MTNFVLVHGSYQGGWIWQRVASRLRAAGHTVYAPTMLGCAERRHELRAGIDTSTSVDEIADLLYFQLGELIDIDLALELPRKVRPGTRLGTAGRLGWTAWSAPETTAANDAAAPETAPPDGAAEDEDFIVAATFGATARRGT